MKVKNVINGMTKYYALDEINIITPSKVIFSGKYEQWKATDVDMILYKKVVENSEV